VFVATNTEHVDMFLNGKPAGSSAVDKYQMVTFEIPYAPGVLEARASNGGKEVARYDVETTGAPAALRLIAYRTSLSGDGYDAEPVTVEVVDSKGRVVPTADAEVTFSSTGPGTIIGLNNGDPTNHESEKGTQHSVFHGVAQAIVQTRANGSGSYTLQASSPGLNSAELKIEVTATPTPPAVAEIPNPPLTILTWKRSPPSMERIDPNQQLMASDMNSWASARPGPYLPPLRGGLFVEYRSTFTPREATQQQSGQIILRDVVGKAEVYLDGKLVVTRTDPAKQTITIPLTPNIGERTISVLIEAPAVGESVGLGGATTIE
jgi:beta-galactosidase